MFGVSESVLRKRSINLQKKELKISQLKPKDQFNTTNSTSLHNGSDFFSRQSGSAEILTVLDPKNKLAFDGKK